MGIHILNSVMVTDHVNYERTSLAFRIAGSQVSSCMACKGPLINYHQGSHWQVMKHPPQIYTQSQKKHTHWLYAPFPTFPLVIINECPLIPQKKKNKIVTQHALLLTNWLSCYWEFKFKTFSRLSDPGFWPWPCTRYRSICGFSTS